MISASSVHDCSEKAEGSMLTRVGVPRCRLCNEPVEDMHVYQDKTSRLHSLVIVLVCHGEIDTQTMQPPAEKMRGKDEYRFWIMAHWPRLAFDQYTLLPLEPTMGAD